MELLVRWFKGCVTFKMTLLATETLIGALVLKRNLFPSNHLTIYHLTI